MSSTAGASSALSPPREPPVAVVREHVKGLKQLAAQREALPAPSPADRRGDAAVPVGPSDTEIARLGDAVSRLLNTSEGLVRKVQQAQRDLDQRDSQLAKAARAPARPAGTAAQEAAVQERPARAAVVALPVPAAPSLAALALQQAQQQLAEARRKLSEAQARFNTARAATEQKRQSALDQAEKWSRQAGRAATYQGLAEGILNKTRVDSDKALTQLGLPPVQPRSTPLGHKDSLQQEFQAYRAGLTECGPGGRWQFRGSVEAGLPKLMAFDALVRTYSPVVLDPLGIGACRVYERRHPQVPAPGPEVAGAMAALALDNVSEGLGLMALEASDAASGRQKADQRSRQMGGAASRARIVEELRMKDLAGYGEHARRLLELLADNRQELQEALAGFMHAGLLEVRAEHNRSLHEADEARKRADAKDPEFALRMRELMDARTVVQAAETRVKELPPLPCDLPGPRATAAPSAAAVPQIPSAPPGPGLAQDAATRSTRRRGRTLDLEALRDGARQRLGEVSTALRDAEDALQKAREDLDDALVRRDRADQAARQNRAQQREEQAARRKDLKELDAAIAAARAGLLADPALQGLIDPGALQRVIDIHLDPDDEAVRRRALEKTGLNGRYDSVEHMAEAVADVHEAAQRRFPQLFAARTPAEFEQAAQAHPAYDAARKALVNIPHEHGRLVGQGYDAKPDRRDELIPLTRSEYGVAWCGDRVRVSHLHPGVPRRTLRTLDGPPGNPE
jgi:hypothetical protein